MTAAPASSKRSIGKVLGDFSSLLGLFAFMDGLTTLAAVLILGGLMLYAISAAGAWLMSK